MQVITVKRGQSLTIDFPFTNEDGSVFPLTGYTATSEIWKVDCSGAKREYEKVGDFATSVDELGGIVTLKATDVEVDAWPVSEKPENQLRFDVFLTNADPEGTLATETVLIQVDERITGHA